MRTLDLRRGRRVVTARDILAAEDIAWFWAMVCQAALQRSVSAWQELQARGQRPWNGPTTP